MRTAAIHLARTCRASPKISSGPSRSSTTMPSSARTTIRSKRPRSGAGAPPATRAAWSAAGSDRRSPFSLPRASISGSRPSTGSPRRTVPSPATGTPSTSAAGLCSTTWISSPWGKSAWTSRARTTGYAAMARSRSAWSTCSVVIVCAAEASAALTRGASFVVRPVTFTSSTATRGESRSQNWKPAASTTQTASTARTCRRIRGGSRRSVSTRSAKRRAPPPAAPRARRRVPPAAFRRAPFPAGRRPATAWPLLIRTPQRRRVHLAEELDLGLELHAEALADAAAALGDQGDHVGRGGLPHVLHEVGVLLREARAAHCEPAAAGLVEQHPGAAALGARVVGVLERGAEGLDAGRLRRLARGAHVRERRLHRVGLRRAQREGRARDDLVRAEVRAPVVEAELLGGAALAAGRRGHLDPLEHARQVAPVGVRVHLHRATDGAGDVHAELEAAETGACGEGRRLREPGAAAAEQALAVLLDRCKRAVQLHDKSSEPFIRYEQVRAGPDHSYLDPLAGGPGEQLGECLRGLRPREEVSVAARADRGQAGQRVGGRDSGGDVHATSLRASSSTFPAPSVSSRSPSVSSPRRLRSASSSRGIHQTERPAPASAAA